ncbi:MAG: erythromycin esterase family protein [Bryobacterales bacterium]|nr:erythromycin esterase family protein [Bryobacterales bacterium]
MFSILLLVASLGDQMSAQLTGPGCAPGSTQLCTPDSAVITPTGPGAYRVILPANQRRAVRFPDTAGTLVVVSRSRGTICWDPALAATNGCNGPLGSSTIPARDIRFQPEDFINPQRPAGALVYKTEGDATFFAVNDRDNEGAFRDNLGYFEFEVAFLPESTVEENKTWVRRNAIPLRTVEAGNGFEDMQPLRQMIGNARIVSLGEATHGTREFFQLKHRMLEFLATEMGFNIFSIEANMPESYRMNDYVLRGVGDPKAILRGMYFWTWQTEEVLAMVEWMREFNASGKGRVQFTGFDMQTPNVALDIVRDFITRTEPEYLPEVDRVLGEVPRLGAAVQGFGLASASLPASAASGRRIRYSGWIKTDQIRTGYAGLWLRVDGPGGSLFLDNMSNRGATGTQDWTRYEINTSVPANATGVVFGALHPGNGTAWFDALSIEIDGQPYTNPAIDFDFESPQPRGFSVGGAGFRVELDAAQAFSGKQSLRSRYLNDTLLTAPEAAEQCAAVVSHMKDARERYIATGQTAAAVDWVIQNARVVCQVAELRAGSNTRDRAMAENVSWILDQNPGSKIVLWAHNGHVATNGYRGYVPMGRYLWDQYGTDMIIFGFAFHQGSFQAIDGLSRQLREFTVTAPPGNTLDALYASAGVPLLAIDMRRVPLTGPGSMMRLSLETRTIGSLYDERTPFAFYSEMVAPDAFDAMFFVESTTRARPMQ